MSAEARDWAWDQDELTSSQKLVLLHLANRARASTDKDWPRMCWPGIPEICERTGVTPRTAVASLAELEARGLIARERRVDAGGHRTSDLFQLNFTGKSESLGAKNAHREEGSKVQKMSSLGAKNVKNEGSTPFLYEPTMNPSNFAQFWKIYPLRKDRKRAEDNFRRALKIAKAEEILAGAERYAAEVENDGRERRFIKSPVSWLSGECWRDETQPPRRRPAAPVREVEPGDEWMLR